jgi:adenosine deaminase
VGAAQHPELQAMLKSRGVAIEICPSSNIHTGCITQVSEHPARELHDAGLIVCPCADNTLLSQTTTEREYALVGEQCGFTPDEMVAMAAAAFTAAFDPR